MKLWKNPIYRPAFRYVKSLTAHYSKSFYAVTQLLPQETRWATYALYGFCRYADNLIDLPRNRSVEELLQEVEMLRQEIILGYRTGESEHPILQPFILMARRYGIPLEYPLDLLKGVEMDLTRKRYQNFSELYLFAYRVAGVVGLMMTHVLGYSNGEAFHYAEKLGIAMQLTNILRDIKEDAAMGRIYLPLEELHQFGLTEKDILQKRWNAAMKTLMEFQVKRAEQYYQSAQPGIAMLHPRSRFAIAAASRIYGGILDKIKQNDYNPFLGRVYVSKSEKIIILLKERWGRSKNRPEELKDNALHPAPSSLPIDTELIKEV